MHASKPANHQTDDVAPRAAAVAHMRGRDGIEVILASCGKKHTAKRESILRKTIACITESKFG